MKKTLDLKNLILDGFERIDSLAIRKEIIWSACEKLTTYRKTSQQIKWEHFNHQERAAIEFILCWVKLHFYNQIHSSALLASDNGIEPLIRIYRENIYKINQVLLEINQAGPEQYFQIHKSA